MKYDETERYIIFFDILGKYNYVIIIDNEWNRLLERLGHIFDLLF